MVGCRVVLRVSFFCDCLPFRIIMRMTTFITLLVTPCAEGFEKFSKFTEHSAPVGFAKCGSWWNGAKPSFKSCSDDAGNIAASGHGSWFVQRLWLECA